MKRLPRRRLWRQATAGALLLAGCSSQPPPQPVYLPHIPTAQEIASQVEADMAARQPAPQPTPEATPAPPDPNEEVTVSPEARAQAINTITAMNHDQVIDTICNVLDSYSTTTRRTDPEMAGAAAVLSNYVAGRLKAICTPESTELFYALAKDLQRLAETPWTRESAGDSAEQTLAMFDATHYLASGFVSATADQCSKVLAEPRTAQPQPQRHHHPHRHVATPKGVKEL